MDHISSSLNANSKISLRRVAVTGIGMINSLGLNVQECWHNALSGKSGIVKLDYSEKFPGQIKIAGKVQNYTINENLLPLKDQSRFDLFIHYALTCTQEAWSMAQLQSHTYLPYRSGIILGVGMGGFPYIEKSHQDFLEKGAKRISPFTIPSFIPNMASGKVAMHFQLKGINHVTTSACASSSHAIAAAATEIMLGRQDLMVTGGSEAVISEYTLGGFQAMKALSRNPDASKASRPFDKDRDGFVMGEGAGILILEDLDKARQRGISILAEIVGIGATDDAYHITAPDPEGQGVIECMRQALGSAGITTEQIDYINAHGTSTPQGDIAETNAIKKVFGQHAYNLNISSTKSMTGHLLGAAGAVESIFCIKALIEQIVPPTINLDCPDDACDLNYTAHQPIQRKINFALNNSFGFGGTNSSLVFKRA